MKKLDLSIAEFFLIWCLSSGPVSAKITKDEHKVSFKMTENETGFFMADDTNLEYWQTKLGYRLTIYNADGWAEWASILEDHYRQRLEYVEWKRL